VQALEIEKPASCVEDLASTSKLSTSVSAPPAGFSDKISHLIDIVNGKGASKVVNPDVTPMVVYPGYWMDFFHLGNPRA